MARFVVFDHSLYRRSLLRDHIVRRGHWVAQVAGDWNELIAAVRRETAEACVAVLPPDLDAVQQRTLVQVLGECGVRTVLLAPGDGSSARFLESSPTVTIEPLPANTTSSELIETAFEEAWSRIKPSAKRPDAPRRRPVTATPADRLVVIASSAGGPAALASVIPNLPRNLPAAVVIVQHMPRSFTTRLAARLNAASQIPVGEVLAGEVALAGQVYLAQGNRHLMLEPGEQVVRFRVGYESPIRGVRPSADLALGTAAEIYGESLLGVILTGMGTDGALGLELVRRNGGRSLVQDAASSMIDGMPRASRDRGLAQSIAPLSAVPGEITRLVRALPQLDLSKIRPVSAEPPTQGVPRRQE